METLKRLIVLESASMSSIDNARKRWRSRAHDYCSQNPEWRRLVVDWLYSIIDNIGADRELVYITVDIFDRYLTVRSQITRKYHQDKNAYETAAIAALVLAMKLYAPTEHDLNWNKDFYKIIHRTITIQNVSKRAKDIYTCLNWDQHIPTAARFANALVQVLPKSLSEHCKNEAFDSAVFQIELSIQDEMCSTYPASLVAWMALENALSQSDQLTDVEMDVFRTQVAEVSGHEYNTALRRKLQSFLTSVIPQGNGGEKECLHILQQRPLKDIPVVSCNNLDNFQEAPSTPCPQHQQKIPHDFYRKQEMCREEKPAANTCSLHRSEGVKCLDNLY